MLSYIWDSMLVVLVGGIGWSVFSFLLIAIFSILAFVLLLIFDNEDRK